MEVIYREISTIKPYEKNAKKHPDKQIRQIMESIKEFGFQQPIVVDSDDAIIVGHGRFLAAQALGLQTVPVVKALLSEQQIKAYRLADNKLNESEWDKELLLSELKELNPSMFELTGFEKSILEDINITLGENTGDSDTNHGTGLVTCPECGCEFNPKKE